MITGMVSKGALMMLIVTASSAAAPITTGRPLTLQPESRLWVEGTSTVRSFSCKAGTVQVSVETNSATPVNAAAAGEKVVESMRVEVPSRALDCDNGKMNGHMYKAIKADAHPAIIFTLSSYEFASNRSTPGAVILTGTLVLGGVEKPATVQAQVQETADGFLRVTGAHEIRLSEFGLKAPSLMLGTMKVGDVVQVKYDLLLKQ